MKWMEWTIYFFSILFFFLAASTFFYLLSISFSLFWWHSTSAVIMPFMVAHQKTCETVVGMGIVSLNPLKYENQHGDAHKQPLLTLTARIYWSLAWN